MADLQRLARSLGRDHELAAALWDTGWYEARMLASFVDEPALVTPAQMDRWCRDFDNWAICDTVCFHLFDRTPHAFRKVAQWSSEPGRVRQARRLRAPGVSRPARQDRPRRGLRALPALDRAPPPRRAELRQEGRELGAARDRRAQPRAPCGRGGAGPAPGGLTGAPRPRWVGKDALRQLTRPAVARRLAARERTKR